MKPAKVAKMPMQSTMKRAPKIAGTEKRNCSPLVTKKMPASSSKPPCPTSHLPPTPSWRCQSHIQTCFAWLKSPIARTPLPDPHCHTWASCNAWSPPAGPNTSSSTVPTHPNHWGGHGVEGGWGQETQKLGVPKKKSKPFKTHSLHTLFQNG